MDLNEFVEYAALYDIYGSLLTEKQREIFEMYYMKNLSVVEIAREKNITRQGVYDTINSAQKQLKNYEKKLKFIKLQKEKVSNIKKLLQRLDKNFDYDTFKRINKKIMELLS